MTKPKAKPARKPRAKKAQPTNAEIMAAIVALASRVDEFEKRFNVSLEQTRAETGASREAGRMQERVNKGLTDTVYGDGKPGLQSDMATNTTALGVLEARLTNLTDASNRIFFALIGAGLSVAVAIVVVALK